ncbi:hypothetical protein FRB93_003106 [Tulasnella sp. JGI-2019a]|nr:hypothetical protein FRB93_003106 [Tulasnella sp. JGI-2019a]
MIESQDLNTDEYRGLNHGVGHLILRSNTACLHFVVKARWTYVTGFWKTAWGRLTRAEVLFWRQHNRVATEEEMEVIEADLIREAKAARAKAKTKTKMAPDAESADGSEGSPEIIEDEVLEEGLEISDDQADVADQKIDGVTKVDIDEYFAAGHATISTVVVQLDNYDLDFQLELIRMDGLSKRALAAELATRRGFTRSGKKRNNSESDGSSSTTARKPKKAKVSSNKGAILGDKRKPTGKGAMKKKKRKIEEEKDAEDEDKDEVGEEGGEEEGESMIEYAPSLRNGTRSRPARF